MPPYFTLGLVCTFFGWGIVVGEKFYIMNLLVKKKNSSNTKRAAGATLLALYTP
jgi:hypothetical protein